MINNSLNRKCKYTQMRVFSSPIQGASSRKFKRKMNSSSKPVEPWPITSWGQPNTSRWWSTSRHKWGGQKHPKSYALIMEFCSISWTATRRCWIVEIGPCKATRRSKAWTNKKVKGRSSFLSSCRFRMGFLESVKLRTSGAIFPSLKVSWTPPKVKGL